MEKVIQQCDRVLAKLYRFDKKMSSFGPPIDDDRLKVFERTIGSPYRLNFVVS